MSKFERDLRACASDALGLMAKSIPNGFTELDEEELIVRIEQFSNRLAVEKFDLEENTKFKDIIQAINKCLMDWSSVAGRKEKRQQDRRKLLSSLRDFYVQWCLENSPSETRPSPKLSTGPTDPDQRVRARMGQIINSCAVKSIPGVYILGSFDYKKTIHTQQKRAVALVNSLSRFDEIGATKRVAVIGGGAGGMTAARAAASKGASVAIFEKQNELAPLQSRNTQRIVHPNIYDWPEGGALREESELPFLNWSAGVCDEVFSKITREFLEYAGNKGPDRLCIHTGASISNVGVAEFSSRQGARRDFV